MRDVEIKSRQLWIWMAAAMSAPLAHFSGRGWLSTLLAAVAVLPLTVLPRRDWRNMGKVLTAVEFVWLSLVTGILLQNSGVYWPSSRNEVAVPLTLLALTAATRLAAGPRIGPVIGLILVVLYLPAAAGAGAQLECGWLTPRVGPWQPELLVTLMTPALAAAWTPDLKGQTGAVLGAGVMAVLLGVLTQGLLSWRVAFVDPAPFYEVARTARLGDTASLESVISVAVTLGWYALSSFLVGTAGTIAKENGMDERTGVILSSLLAAVFAGFGVKIPGIWLIVGSGFLWILMPLVAAKRKMKKGEKRY